MLSQEYAHGPRIDNPWADLEHDGAGVLARYYHADLLGSIRPITDGAGDVIQAYDFGAARPGIRLWRFAPTGRRPRFGETTECIFPFPFQPFQYAAREDDPDSKLDYNRARYYNPRAGRCISPDPLGAAGGRTNRFLYVGNSPTRFKDPTGLMTINEFAMSVLIQALLSSFVTGLSSGLIAAAAGYDRDVVLKAALAGAVVGLIVGGGSSLLGITAAQTGYNVGLMSTIARLPGYVFGIGSSGNITVGLGTALHAGADSAIGYLTQNAAMAAAASLLSAGLIASGIAAIRAAFGKSDSSDAQAPCSS